MAQAEDWETWYQLAAEGKFKEIPAKIQIKHLGNLERIHRQNLKSSTKQMCAESGFGALQESARATLPAKCWEPRVTTLSSTISGGTAIRARRSSSWRTLTRKRSSSFTTTSRFGRTAGVHWRDWQSGCPIHRWLVVTSNYSIMDILKDLEDRQLRRPSLVGSCGFEMLSRDEIKNWDTYETVTPRLWPPSLNE